MASRQIAALQGKLAAARQDLTVKLRIAADTEGDEIWYEIATLQTQVGDLEDKLARLETDQT